MKRKHLPRAILLLVMLISFIPVGGAIALSSVSVPPADFFQLPWEQGVAWMAIDGIDNGAKRPLSSSHNYRVGGAIDFAPRKYMYRGEDTSNFWVAAAGPGMVIDKSTCHVILDHGNGWVTQYQFLGNVQVELGQSVERNQRLGIIADGVRYKFCLGSIEPDVPHLHFMLRPTLIGATFSGWEINYYSFFSVTTFSKDNIKVGLYKPLMNTFGSTSTSTPTPTATQPTPTAITPTPSGPHSSTDVDRPDINVGETTVVSVNLNNVPAEGYTSAEFTCTYDPVMIEVSNIFVTDLFGTDPAIAIQGPQNGDFVVAIAGSHGQKATASGTAFTFNAKGLQVGQTTIECKARVSKGDNILINLPSTSADLNIHGVATTPTPPPTQTPPPATAPLLTGQVFASKSVTVELYSMDITLIKTITANPDGTFSISAPAGTYTAVASADGFLNAQATVVLADGTTTTLSTAKLPAGDIDGNNVVDQFDAITIGMNYNTAVPSVADLNSDGIINVLDLELLAGNYRKTGPINWQ